MIVTYLPFLEVLKDVSGGNKKIKNQDYQFEGLIPIIDQGKTLVGGYTDNPEYKFNKAKLPVIVFGDHTKNFKYIDQPFAMGADGIKILKPTSDKYYEKYLYHYLRQVRLTSGGYDRHYKYLIRISIPIPSLSEQKRIAAILDKAEALRDKRKKSIAKLDDLLQSVFLDMFGDPVTNPKEWEKRPLSEICDIVAPMVDPRKEEYLNLLHYGPDRISKDTGELLHAKTAREDNLISGKFLCNHGEILYSKIRPYLNKVALVKERCLCSADVYPINPNIEQTTREFIFFLLRSRGFLDYVAGFSRRANIPKVNREQLFGYEAILPPISLQNEFSKKYFKISSSIDKAKDSFDLNNNLFSSLQQRAFRGEL